MDRNQVIGFSLLAVLAVAYIFYSQHEQKVYLEQKKADSVAYAAAHPRPIVDSSKVYGAAARVPDSVAQAIINQQPPAYHGQAEVVTLENKKLNIRFSSKGAFPISADIKDYKTYDKKDLYLFNGPGNQLSALLPVDNGKSTADLYFVPVLRELPNGDKSLDFTADLGQGKKMVITYTLPADDYMLQCRMALTGITANTLPLFWQVYGLHTEKDIAAERQSARGGATQVYYQDKSGDGDYFTIHDEEKIIHHEAITSWLGFRKQYFSTALISDSGFTRMDTRFMVRPDDSNIVARNQANLMLPLKTDASGQYGILRWYIGPNDYHTLQSYKINLDEMVPLGYGIMAFVKYINKALLVPIFYFIAGIVKNYAITIILMTILIRLILSFFTYKSYLSSAKMRVLKPELDDLRIKCGDDQQKFSMEQMKLYKSAGVNPLGGCLPMLFQLPILLSMYYMFPSFIEFRQQHFLWCDDLSSYDSILSWHTDIPVLSSVYGNHISLFTLLMTATSMFLAIYNRNMAPQDPNNPNTVMLKYMPYIFPVILMGMFNKMAAALTFYYTCSNILSIAQQFVIQKYFIDEKAIHAQLQENKTKPATPSKWAQRLEEMQKLQAEKAKNTPRINKK